LRAGHAGLDLERDLGERVLRLGRPGFDARASTLAEAAVFMAAPSITLAARSTLRRLAGALRIGASAAHSLRMSEASSDERSAPPAGVDLRCRRQ
jgi:hypothetical protein